MAAFKGAINVDVRDSVQDWGPYTEPTAPGGLAERPDRAVRRHRAGGVVAVRWAHRDADHAAAGRRRADLHAVAHHGAVQPDPLVPPHRPQPPPERLRLHRRGGDRLPGIERPHPDGERLPRRGAAPARLEHVLGRQEPQRAVRRVGHGRLEAGVAAGAAASTASTASSAARPTSGIRTSSTTTTTSTSRTCPEDGYHLSKDLADKALTFIRDSKQSRPDKPWYMFFCPGANHAPHHAPQEYIDKYKGKFDDGYEAYREWVLPRMIERGILPEGTELSPINPMTEGTFSPLDLVRPWDSLADDEKRLFSRMAEVYAGFSEYTDAQVGRIVDYLEESGQLDNTLIFYCADNGASGEGTPNGSVNENKFFNEWPDDLAENLAMIDELGGPETYNHYPTGWAFGVLDAVPHVQALLATRAASATRW